MKNKSLYAHDCAIHQRLSDRLAVRRGILGLFAVFLLACYAFLGGTVLAQGDGDAVANSTLTASILAPFALAGGVRKEDDGPDGGGDTDPIAAKILKKLDEQKREIEEMEKNIGTNLETKAEAEALHKAIEKFDGLESDFKDYMQKFAKLEKKMFQARSEISGNPLERIKQDEEKRTLITAPARVAYLRAHNKAIPQELLDAAQRMGEIGQRAVSGGASPGSGYIDGELETDVYQLAAMYGKWNTFDAAPASTRSLTIPVDTSDPDMLWIAEGATATEEAYTGTTVALTIKKALGWISVTNEMLEDDEIGLANHLLTKFMRQFGYRMDWSCFAADGTDDTTDGEFTGIFEGGTSYVAASGNVSIATLDFDDFVGLVAGADEALGELPTTRWWLHPQVLVQLLKIKDSNGRPIFLTSVEAPAPGGIGSILGTPVVTANACPKTDGVSEEIAVYGDSQGLAVRVRRDFEYASSTEAQFTADKTVFRARARAGVVIKDATAFEVLTTAAS